MKDKKIAVVVGGPSTEAEVSRRTGAAIADALTKKGYHIETIELVPKEFAKTLTEKGRPASPCSSLPNLSEGLWHGRLHSGERAARRQTYRL